MATRRQWSTAVEDANIVETEKPAFEKAPAKAIFPIDPPAKIGGEPAEHPLQEVEIGSAAECLLHAVEENRPPGLYRRVDVAEIPLIGRDLTGRVQINLAQKQVELLFGEIDIDRRQRKCMKGKVPGGEPRILPLVRHRDDVIADHVEPLAVADLPGRGPHWIGAVLLEPSVRVVKEVLLAP